MTRDQIGSAITLDEGAMPMADRHRLAERTGTRGAPQEDNDSRVDDAELLKEMHPRMSNI